jgi:tetratricopeptide (TPR) repeat protein
MVGVALVSLLALVAGWLTLRPLRADMAASAGRQAIADEQGDLAEKELSTARHLAPWEATFTFDQVRLYSLANVPEKALQAAKDGARLEPGDSSYFLVVAQVADALKKPELARTWYDKALKIDPYGTDVLKAAILSAARAHDADRADGFIDRLLDISRTRADIWTTVGQARAAEGRIDDAKAAYEKALELSPTDEDAKKGLKQLGQ